MTLALLHGSVCFLSTKVNILTGVRLPAPADSVAKLTSGSNFHVFLHKFILCCTSMCLPLQRCAD